MIELTLVCGLNIQQTVSILYRWSIFMSNIYFSNYSFDDQLEGILSQFLFPRFHVCLFFSSFFMIDLRICVRCDVCAYKVLGLNGYEARGPGRSPVLSAIPHYSSQLQIAFRAKLHGKNGFVTATKLGTTDKVFVAATKNFAAATKCFVDRTKHFVVVTKCFCHPYFNK